MSRSALALVLASISGTAFAQAGTGLRGRLTDAKTGEPLLVCPVTVISGGNTFVETDLEGNYELPLPPGTYDVRFWCDQYEGVDIKAVKVEQARPARSRAQAGGGLVRRRGRRHRDGGYRGSSGLLLFQQEDGEHGAGLDRQRADLPLAGLEHRGRGQARDVGHGGGPQRLPARPGRPLRGHRRQWGQPAQHGSGRPSGAELDLFPNALLSTLTVQKTYSAELGGAFAGGVLGIETNSYPATFQAQVKLSLGVNSESTFHSRRSYEGREPGRAGHRRRSPRAARERPRGPPLTTREPSGRGGRASASPTSGAAAGPTVCPMAAWSVSAGNTHQWAEGGPSAIWPARRSPGAPRRPTPTCRPSASTSRS